jgi:hypothetical protein
MNPTTQLTADDSDLTAWAKEHGPEYLRYAANQGYTVKSGTMDLIGSRLAEALGGRLIRDTDLINWKARERPDAAWVERWEALADRLPALHLELKLPAGVALAPLTVLRVEEQPDATQPSTILKYTGTIVKLQHPATADRLIVLNFEATP